MNTACTCAPVQPTQNIRKVNACIVVMWRSAKPASLEVGEEAIREGSVVQAALVAAPEQIVTYVGSKLNYLTIYL